MLKENLRVYMYGPGARVILTKTKISSYKINNSWI